MSNHKIDTVLIHPGPDLRPMFTVHLVDKGERRVITQPLEWATLARLVAAGAKMIAENLRK